MAFENKRDVSLKFIEFMIECGALLFGDFTLKSGRKSPYFINTGEYKTGNQISKLGDFYANLIKNSELKFDVLFGPAYKGISLAVITSAKLASDGRDVKFSFDRKERKDHGDSKDILGSVPQDGDEIAIIEDVTTAGTSVRETIKLLQDCKINAEITALYISIDRMEKGTGEISATEQIKKEYGIDVFSIATTMDIIEYLENTPENCKPVPNAELHAKKMREYLEQYGI
ncbi:MAG: orotate phosphoribosyltransferase [Oscillospiraceae bacterium]|nr:orotate phosphoribosyltransferase [Oscillospiraceae bacterium]